MTACGSAPEDSDPAFVRGPPEVQTVSFSCDAGRRRWALDVEVLRWSAGGWLWLTRDATYIERHEVPSVGATVDGSADTLAVELRIEADWRLVDPGSSTAFDCDRPPDVFVEVIGFEGQPSACASRGTSWTNVPDLPTCHSTLAF